MKELSKVLRDAAIGAVFFGLFGSVMWGLFSLVEITSGRALLILVVPICYFYGKLIREMYQKWRTK